MKKLILLILLFSQFSLYAQFQFFIDFESYPPPKVKIYIDSAKQNNIWQIGQLNKTEFNKALRGNISLVTDTSNSYPINNKSTIYLQVPVSKYFDSLPKGFEFVFDYRVNTDSLNDFGIVELSIDNGESFFRITQDSSFISVVDSLYFTGNEEKTASFKIVSFPDYFYKNPPDSYIFKFVFYSDSIENNLDGWMIDNILILEDFSYSIDERESFIPIVFPSVFINNLSLSDYYKGRNVSIKIFDLSGKLIWLKNHFDDTIIKPDIPQGMYIIQIDSNNLIKTQKIIKQ